MLVLSADLLAFSIFTINTAWISAVCVILELSQLTHTLVEEPQVKLTYSQFRSIH